MVIFLIILLSVWYQKTGTLLLWKKIKSKAKEARLMSDKWQAYKNMLPNKNSTQSKAQTYTIEGYNSLCRHYLARLRRRTKCYSKSQQMLYLSLILLFEKRNNNLSILNY